MRKLLLAFCVAGLCFGSIGCKTESSTVFSGSYWKRHVVKILDDFHEFRVDFDRVVWDLEERPIEDY